MPWPVGPVGPVGGGRNEGMGSTCARVCRGGWICENLDLLMLVELLVFENGNIVEFFWRFFVKWRCFCSKQKCETRKKTGHYQLQGSIGLIWSK